MLQRAEILLNQRRPSDAEETIRHYLADEPNSVWAYVLLAQALMDQERYSSALEAADQAVALEPSWGVGASVYLASDDRKAARKSIEEAIQLDPEDPDYYGLSAQIHMLERNWEAAESEARLGLSLDPDHSLSRHMLSHTLISTGRQGVAHESLEAGLSNNPLDPDAHVQVGYQALHTGDTDRALEAFEEALRLDAEHEGARGGLVEALKARSPIYSWILRGFLKLSSLPGNTVLYLLVGFFILNRIARSVSKSNPDLAPLLAPVTWIYMSIVAITWFAESFFDMLLLTTREGRMALVGEARQRALAFSAGLFLVAVTAVYAIVQQDSEWLWVGAFILFAQIPIVSAFSCKRKGARNVMMGIAVICNLFLVIGLSMVFLSANPDHDTGSGLVILGGFGGAISSWLGLIFIVREG